MRGPEAAVSDGLVPGPGGERTQFVCLLVHACPSFDLLTCLVTANTTEVKTCAAGSGGSLGRWQPRQTAPLQISLAPLHSYLTLKELRSCCMVGTGLLLGGDSQGAEAVLVMSLPSLVSQDALHTVGASLTSTDTERQIWGMRSRWGVRCSG